MTDEAQMKTLKLMTEEVKAVLREQTPTIINEVYVDEDGKTAVIATRDQDGIIFGAKRLPLTELPFMLAVIGMILVNPEPILTQESYH